MRSSKKKVLTPLFVAALFIFSFSIYSLIKPKTSSSIISSSTTDFVIVTMNSPSQAKYWQEILDEQASEETQYIVVHEDWSGGADNGLGSLYAFIQANKKAHKIYGIDLKKILENDGGVSLFHCAGMGKRLYPLTASEYNNKSAIKVPKGSETQSILELVLDQTLTQMPILKGRLSVFWGDQIFIPSISLHKPKSHAEVFTMVSHFPSKDEWVNKNLDQYGLIIIGNKQAKLVEKTTYSNLLNIVANDRSHKDTPNIGVSLGSFSISATMLDELLITFHNELANKNGKLNTDYHFWMPLTWEKQPYVRFMTAKGYDQHDAINIYDRMQNIKKNLEKGNKTPVFGVQNVGEDALWWDFGNTKSYYNNMMATLYLDDKKGQKLAEILDLSEYYHPDKNSILINCDIDDLQVRNSILVNVTGQKVTAHDSILVNSIARDLAVSESLVYNISEENSLALSNGEVRADIFFNDHPNQVVFYTSMRRNNKLDWAIRLPKNNYAFDEVYKLNESLTKTEIEQL
jgi:hypothetical protein